MRIRFEVCSAAERLQYPRGGYSGTLTINVTFLRKTVMDQELRTMLDEVGLRIAEEEIERAEKDLKRARRLTAQTLEKLAQVDIATLSVKGRAAYRRNVGVLLWAQLSSEPAVMRWIEFTVSEQGQPQTTSEYASRVLGLLKTAATFSKVVAKRSQK